MSIDNLKYNIIKDENRKGIYKFIINKNEFCISCLKILFKVKLSNIK